MTLLPDVLFYFPGPIFTQPLYSTTIPENFELRRPILTGQSLFIADVCALRTILNSLSFSVSARDADSGVNAEIVYDVDDKNFTVNDRGEISARKPLDADQNLRGFYIYNFTVAARDRGEQPRSARSRVHIRTENVNDEKPQFLPNALYAAHVNEDALGNTPVIQIQTQDPDRDQVTYALLTRNGESSRDGFFEIDQDTGTAKFRV